MYKDSSEKSPGICNRAWDAREIPGKNVIARKNPKSSGLIVNGHVRNALNVRFAPFVHGGLDHRWGGLDQYMGWYNPIMWTPMPTIWTPSYEQVFYRTYVRT